ncbi:lipid-A-disaccharide synthase [Desulfohalovibrio reitneri]|uniref:lipid-A-disaccharide synthase n=1 Tax=Desulfohalovibrio reitneri TaxID=1307759 RepID=UPI0004A74D2B|nr:lipid-A-disaccharide synthase [Desulfohalovibrio reitneri]
MPQNHIWINAGEVSGDMHGAALARALLKGRPDLRLTGMGGEYMRAAGVQTRLDIRDLSALGLTEVVASLPRVGKLLWRTWRELKRLRPAAVVLLDTPDYTFQVARMARRLGIPVYFYISPQVWAWRKGRVNFLSRVARGIFCILPFEEAFYAEHGARAEYVGNPLLDELAERPDLAEVEREPGRVLVLPGSRAKEVDALLPEFGAAAAMLLGEGRDLRFSLARAPSVSEERIRADWPGGVPMDIVRPDGRYAAMKRADMAWAASGTVALETALLGTPTIVAYRLSGLTFALAKRIIKVEHISLPNLILGERVFPELLQDEASAGTIAAHARRWLPPGELEAVRQRLADLAERMGEPGAPGRAASSIIQDLTELGRLP